jgi:hypothetical protein
MNTRIKRREIERLSAYLDDQLSRKERIRLERDLQTRADLRALLDDLQRTRGLLRSQLVVRAPRNFTLTSQMAGVKASRPASRRLAPAFSLASVMAVALFILVLVGDFLSLGRQPALFQVASRAVSLPMMAAPMEVAPTEVAAPAALEAETIEGQVEAESPPSAAPLVESAITAATSTPAATAEAPLLAEAYPPPGAEMAKNAGAVQDVVATATLTEPPPAPQLTAIAQVEEMPAEEPVEEAGGVSQPAIQPRWQTWRVAEFSLALLALGFGILAYILSRSRRA